MKATVPVICSTSVSSAPGVSVCRATYAVVKLARKQNPNQSARCLARLGAPLRIMVTIATGPSSNRLRKAGSLNCALSEQYGSM
jgi:hypothetical protein